MKELSKSEMRAAVVLMAKGGPMDLTGLHGYFPRPSSADGAARSLLRHGVVSSSAGMKSLTIHPIKLLEMLRVKSLRQESIFASEDGKNQKSGVENRISPGILPGGGAPARRPDPPPDPPPEPNVHAPDHVNHASHVPEKNHAHANGGASQSRGHDHDSTCYSKEFLLNSMIEHVTWEPAARGGYEEVRRTTASIISDINRFEPRISEEHLSTWGKRILHENAGLVHAAIRALQQFSTRERVISPAGFMNRFYLDRVNRPKEAPDLAAVEAYAQEKGINGDVARRFFWFWELPQNSWRKRGSVVDWKVEFQGFAGRLRRGHQEGRG